jgi:tetratricopeptide (TPR) repeat protein
MPGGSQISSVESSRRAYARSVALIGLQAAQGLAYAHARGVIHRDIKPSNLLLDTAGVVWITDFGLAKADDDGLTQSGDLLGTLRYMAPERFSGTADTRADVYALGLTLYELLTLEPAFEAPDRLRLIEQIKSADPVRPRLHDRRIPRDLETILLKAVDKDARRRYQTADALAEDLRRFRDDEPILARRATPPERYARWARRNPGVAVLGGVLTAVLLLATAGSLVVAGRMATLAERQRLGAHSERVARLAESEARAHEEGLRQQAEKARRDAEAALAETEVQRKNAEAARRDAEAALAETEVQRKNAEENFRRARAVVDQYFTQVSESQLLTVPGLQPLRRDLLKSALGFYEDDLARRGRDRDPGLRAALAAVHLKAAKIHLELGDRASAVKDYRGALPLYEALTQADPADVAARNGLAECHFGLAACLPEGTARRDALGRSVALRQELVDSQPTDTRLREDLARSYQALGESQRADKQVKEALDSFLKARDIASSLVRDHPDDPAYRHDFAQNLAQIAESLCNLSRHQDENIVRPMAIEHARAAYEQAPQRVDYGRLYGHLLMREGDNLDSQHRYVEGTRSFRAALQLEETLIRQNPAVPDLRLEYALTLVYFLGKPPADRWPPDAVPLLRQACALLESLPLPGPDQLYALTQLLSLLGERSEPTRPPGEDQARRRRDLDAAADTLRRAIAAGFRDFSELRTRSHSYYPSLHQREDVNGMLADLEARLKAEATAKARNPEATPASGSATATAPGPRRPPTAAALEKLQADLAASQHAIALIHVGMGEANYRKGDLPGAVTELREAARLRPEDAEIRRQADSMHQSAAARDAIRRELRVLHSDEYVRHVDEGVKLRTAKDLESAVRAFRAAIAVRPQVSRAHLELAIALNDQGNLDAALAEIREAVRLTPDDASARDWLGWVLRAKGEIKSAIAEFQEAVRLDPGRLSARRKLCELLLAMGDTRGAVDEMRAAYRLTPENPSLRVQLVTALKAEGEVAEAEAVTGAAKTVDESARHIALGEKHQANKDSLAATKEYRQALVIWPGYARAQRLLAEALRQGGQINAAVAEYRKALALEPHRASTHNNFGLALESLGDLDGAIIEFRTAIRINHGAIAIEHGNLARALMARNDFDGAIAARREAIRIEPDNLSRYDLLGLALVHRGSLDEALTVFRAAHPEPGLALAEYASALRRTGRIDEALAAARESVQVAPKLARAQQNLGWALLGKNEWAGAAAAYRESIRLKRDQFACHHELGLALAAQGDLDAAIPCFVESLRLNPDFVTTLDELVATLRHRRRRDAALAAAASPAPGLDADVARPLEALMGPLRARIAPDAGIAALDALCRSHPGQVRFRVARARQLAELGRRAEAAADLDRILAETPRIASPWAVDDPARAYPAAAADPEVFERLTALRPDDRTVWIARIRELGRQRRWPEAAATAGRLNALDPADPFALHHEAALRSFLDDHEGYRRVCRAMLDRFGTSPEPRHARWTVLSCLLEPDALSELTELAPLVETVSASMAADKNLWSVLAVGFFDYRAGRFRSAIDRLEPLSAESTPRAGEEVITALACLVRSMAYRKLDQADAARRQLTAAEALARRANFDPETPGPLPSLWNDWLRYQTLHREAERLLRDGAGPAGN